MLMRWLLERCPEAVLATPEGLVKLGMAGMPEFETRRFDVIHVSCWDEEILLDPFLALAVRALFLSAPEIEEEDAPMLPAAPALPPTGAALGFALGTGGRRGEEELAAESMLLDVCCFQGSDGRFGTRTL